MTPEQEKALFDDMKELREFCRETGTSIALIEQQVAFLVGSFKELGTLVTKEELVEVKETTNKHITEVKEAATKHITEVKAFHDSSVEHLQIRVKELEKDKIIRETTEQLTTKRQKWWSDNWHKVFMVVVVCVPSFVAIYNLINTPAKG